MRVSINLKIGETVSLPANAVRLTVKKINPKGIQLIVDCSPSTTTASADTRIRSPESLDKPIRRTKQPSLDLRDELHALRVGLGLYQGLIQSGKMKEAEVVFGELKKSVDQAERIAKIAVDGKPRKSRDR